MRKYIPFLLLGVISCGPIPTPSPSPSPNPTSTPSPSPSPTPSTSCTIIQDAKLTPTLLMDNQLKDLIRFTQAQIGDVCGISPEESLCALAHKLTSQGTEAFMTIDENGKLSDAIFVIRDTDDLYEEHHAVYYANGCWLSNSWKGVWAKADE